MEEERSNNNELNFPLFLFISFACSQLLGVSWGALAIGSGYEPGILAVGIGVVNGIVCSRLSDGVRHHMYQNAALGFSLLGYFTGKFIIISFLIDKGIDYEPENAFRLAKSYIIYISFTDVLNFIANFRLVFRPIDLLWLVLIYLSVRQFGKSRHKSDDEGPIRRRYIKRRFDR